MNQLTAAGVPLLSVMEIAFVPLFNSLRRYILLNFVCNLARHDEQELKVKNIKIIILLGMIALPRDAKWDLPRHTTLGAPGRRGFCVWTRRAADSFTRQRSACTTFLTVLCVDAYTTCYTAAAMHTGHARISPVPLLFLGLNSLPYFTLF